MKKHSKIKSALAVFLASAALLPQLFTLGAGTGSTDLPLAKLFDSNEVKAYSASNGFYNHAFKGTAYVTSHINVQHITDSRLMYKNWNSIYGLATSAWQMTWPQAYSTHRGQDWDTLTPKEPLYAVHAGTVTRAAYDSTYGYRVEYQFGDWLISFSHLSQMSVWQGQTIAKGQKIGNVGATGNVTGEHVHVMLYYKGQLADPHPYLTGEWDFDAKAAEFEGGALKTVAPTPAPSTSSYQPGIYENTAGVGIRVRSGPGTGYAATGTLAAGAETSITQIVSSNGIVWGKHSSGYSALQEGTSRYMTGQYTAGSYKNVAWANLMVRSSASTTASIVGSVAPGNSVNITSFAIVGDSIWGRHAGGWSCLSQGSATYLRRN